MAAPEWASRKLAEELAVATTAPSGRAGAAGIQLPAAPPVLGSSTYYFDTVEHKVSGGVILRTVAHGREFALDCDYYYPRGDAVAIRDLRLHVLTLG